MTLDYGYLLPTRGVVLTSEDDRELATAVESDVLGLARRVEALEFESVWVGDSVLAKPRLEPLATLAAVGTATEEVDLGTAVYLPTLRDPVHVAHLTATVDQLAGGGRLKLGIGVGIGPDVEAEYANLGLDFRTRGRRMDELLEVLTALWDGESVDHDGDFFHLEDASVGFGPVGDPPIYVPTAAFDPSEGFPRPIRDRLVAHGDGWLPIGVAPSVYASSLQEIRGYLSDAGRDPDAFDPALYLDVVIDEDEAAAIDEAREFYDRYYPAWDRLTDDEIRARGAFGPAADVAETVEAYDDAGVETLVVRFTADDQHAQLDRFDDRVR